MTTVYVVYQEGVSIAGIAGVYVSQEDAEFAARSLAAADFDRYHTYEVTPFELGAPPKTTKMLNYPIVDTPRSVFSASK